LSAVPEDSGSNSVGSYLYRFGQFVLDPRKRSLSRADSPVFLTPKTFDVLVFLVRNPNRLVTKEELLQAVCADTFVEEGNLAQYISHLRKALGNNSEGTRLIVTIARKGYQFTGDGGKLRSCLRLLSSWSARAIFLGGTLGQQNREGRAKSCSRYCRSRISQAIPIRTILRTV
jgi:DNA-binding winged helix-turn-helix (wHTH) protein